MPAINKMEMVEWLTISNALSSLWTWLDFGLNFMLVLFFGQEYISRENYTAGFILMQIHVTLFKLY